MILETYQTSVKNLAELYSAHERGELSSTDPRWMKANGYIKAIAGHIVARNAKKLYGPIQERLAEEVAGRFLEKFYMKRLGGDSFEAMMITTMRNDMFKNISRSKSPATISLNDGLVEAKKEATPPPPDADDMFGAVRAAFAGPFRLPGKPMIREAMLTALLSTGRYPSLQALAGIGVCEVKDRTAYNAAAYAVNRAVAQVVRT